MNHEKIKPLLNDYLKYHKHPQNVKLHYFGIPAVIISLLGLLMEAYYFEINHYYFHPGDLLLIFSFIWWFRLDYKLSIMIITPVILAYQIASSIGFYANLALFIIGWIIQLYGHYKYEKQSPAFFSNIKQLILGPFFIFAKAINYKFK
jgi:uncharacterized membrane protein YGL010W